MAAVQRKLVHKQFNSPMGLYSQQNVKETLDRELKAFGTDGIEVDEQIAKPLNLANSAVLRAVEEEDQMKCGYKRVAWPPVSEERIIREFTPQPQASAPLPTPTQQSPSQQHQQQHHQQHQQAPASAANASAPAQGPIYNNIQPAAARQVSPYPNQYQPQQQAQAQPQEMQTIPRQQYSQPEPPQQHPEQPRQYTQAQFSRQASREPVPVPVSPTASPYYSQPQSYIQPQPDVPATGTGYAPAREPMSPGSGWKPIQPPVAKQQYQYHAGVGNQTNAPYYAPPPNQSQHQPHNPQQQYNQPQQQYQPQPQTQQQQSQHYQQQQYRAPSFDNYSQQQQQQPQPQPQPQQQYQAPQYNQQLPPQQQYQPPQPQPQQQQQQQQPQWAHNQPPLQHQPQKQYQPQYQAPTNYPYQSDPQANLYNSYSQPQQQHPISQDQVDYQRQQQQQQQPLPQDYRGGSPGIITLRKEAPVTQQPAPVITSQPAAVSYQGGSNMRGDLKWPPPEYKVAAERENDDRRQLALGPVCRPRKVKRDYTTFFAKNALNSCYPSYKTPPGTQHMLA